MPRPQQLRATMRAGRARPRVAFGAARCGTTSRYLEVVGHFDQIGLEGINRFHKPGSCVAFKCPCSGRRVACEIPSHAADRAAATENKRCEDASHSKSTPCENLLGGVSSLFPHGRGCGVGRSLGIGFGLGVGVGRTVAVGVAVAVGLGVGVGVGGMGVGVGVGPSGKGTRT